MSNDDTELPSIDLAALREVTGGLSDDDGKIVEALKGIQDTINELGKNNSGPSWEQFLPFLMFALGGSGSFSFNGAPPIETPLIYAPAAAPST